MLSNFHSMPHRAEYGNDNRINVGVFHSDGIVSAGLLALLGGLDDMNVLQLDSSEIPTSSSDVIIIDARSAVDYMSAYAAVGFKLRQRLLVIAQIGREWDVREALAIGVHGYVLQNCALEQLAAAVRALSCGGRFMCGELSHVSEAVAIGLTPREVDVLQLMALGHCNKMIARDLGIGVGTVKTHVKGVFVKLGATARTHAVVIASRRGLVNGSQQDRRVRRWTGLAG